MKKRLLLTAIVLSFAISVPALWIAIERAQASRSANIAQRLALLNEIMVKVRDHYVEEVDVVDLTEGMIRSLLEGLDPHSNYIAPEETKRMNERFQGHFYGIGISYYIMYDSLTVMFPIEGTPAYKVGLKPWDKIVKIDGESALGITSDEVQKRLKGSRGTPVNVSVKREGKDDLLDFTIIRNEIPLKSISYYFMIRPGTGYIRLSNFSNTTTVELDEAIEDLRRKSMERLILDLRWNGGGPLDQAVQVADKFLWDGKIVYTKGKYQANNREYDAHKGQDDWRPPLIVMINHSSASASEIVSGAIQDQDRGLVVGQSSFGKGLVQHQFPLEKDGGGTLLLTVAKYYTPLGRLIQRPYKGKDRQEYIHEGIDTNADADSLNLSNKDVYYTPSGRKVYGGGGITPDIILQPNTPTTFGYKLRDPKYIFEFSNRYLRENKDIRTGDFEQFLEDSYVPEDELLSQFKAFLIANGLKFDEKDTKNFENDRNFIERSIKAEIARIAWGRTESGRVYLEGDSEVLAALNLFKEALVIVQNREKAEAARHVR